MQTQGLTLHLLLLQVAQLVQLQGWQREGLLVLLLPQQLLSSCAAP
jgi:hypothetical protein